ncbi:MAG: twin-arginine translocase TatA/TatE family subunit [Desulfobulbaceae bacterium]|jgi:sec-independent protein translocase protein TatA|nr:twin-arginine translocase TatA/TatE family subunit [Desulfobulbaceae bacterium]
MFSGIFQPIHLLVILVIVMIIWGPGKLPELGEGLGKSIRAFKKAIKDTHASASTPIEDSPPPTPIEHQEEKSANYQEEKGANS